MYQVKTYNVISQAGLKELDPQEFAINKEEDPDAIILRSENLLKKEFGNNLKAIVRAGAGFNNIPLKQANEKGIAVFNTPGGNANAVKEMVFSMLIMSVRPIYQAIDFAEHNEGSDVSLRTEAKKNSFRGTELKDRTLGVIGLGHVGSKVANLGLSFGMKVIGYDPFIHPDAAWEIDSRVQRAQEISKLLKESDFVTVHIPYNSDNDHFIDEEKLKLMKKSAVLLNYSRNDIVDDKAVIKALDQKSLKFYATDFAASGLYNRDDVLITPHIGGSTREAEHTAARMAVNELKEFMLNGNLINSVNLPNLNEPFTTNYRVAVVHHNIPNMLGQISTIFGNFHINIDRLSNRSKDDLAYTLVEIEDFPMDQKDKFLASMQEVPAIIRTRFLKKK
ncbi:3-phosphoglycerate dehydrogenase family protein [Xylocopilactobacillus apis]|uniref:D-3-phosphoglycerate dehydrogenase n=1 Tax=Xylocopilactobacillus apis TaxID=2932183 RepID=A0AAU9D2K3_9LACO|nr:3-phosphoglycerate dehydrogenase family protein [Xylocopilactobacillus apis]BDR56726.1 D-3-phosphoglycerate dehydrogenase [Xylocopilactobacillus apis]